ncbi:MAG TPA: DUF167 domain-containing protein [Chlamydiales bacterium]|nr:DUF167 domain-containing protein [Chlamydiales bacterium]
MKNITFQIKVTPNASKRKIDFDTDPYIKVWIHSTPEKGKANAEIIKLFAKTFSVPKSSIEIIKGQTSSIKTLMITSLSDEKHLQIQTEINKPDIS